MTASILVDTLQGDGGLGLHAFPVPETCDEYLRVLADRIFQCLRRYFQYISDQFYRISVVPSQALCLERTQAREEAQKTAYESNEKGA
jgi:hypothetical protein